MCSMVVAQDDPCPEWANTIKLFNAEANTSSDLEMPEVENKSKKKGLYRGVDNSVRLMGGSSKVKLSPSDVDFIFRPFSENIRPQQQIRLYSFEDNKDFRELVVGGTNMFGGSKNKKMEDTSEDLKFEKVSDGCYKVTLAGNLEPGEYAFGLSSTGNADVQSGGGYGSTANTNSQWYAFSVQ